VIKNASTIMAATHVHVRLALYTAMNNVKVKHVPYKFDFDSLFPPNQLLSVLAIFKYFTVYVMKNDILNSADGI
jgi:hypothetical protein